MRSQQAGSYHINTKKTYPKKLLWKLVPCLITCVIKKCKNFIITSDTKVQNLRCTISRNKNVFISLKYPKSPAIHLTTGWRRGKRGEFLNIWKGDQKRETLPFIFLRGKRKSGSYFLLLLNLQFSQFSVLRHLWINATWYSWVMMLTTCRWFLSKSQMNL